MTTIPVESWEKFRERLLGFAQLTRDKRNSWWFRGEPEASNELSPTVDRGRKFKSDAEREEHIQSLLREFRREVVGLGLGASVHLDDAFELLARHHGLPSPHLDWTRSPWIAAFFAYESAPINGTGSVAIYGLDRHQLPASTLQPPEAIRPGVELIDDSELVLRNARAVRQRGVFLRRSTMTRSLEDLLGPALFKFVLPVRDAAVALADLDQMLLNSSMLMYDLDGAAKTAARRIA